MVPLLQSIPTERRIPMQRLQRADQWLGRFACALLQPARRLRRPRAQEAPERVLLIKFWGLGSLQLLTPAVAALRRRHPGARLTLLTLAENRAFAEGLGAFDEVISLDVRCRRWLQVFARITALSLALRSARFERVYDFEFFTRFSAVISFLSGAPRTAGFESPSVWRGGLHAERVTFNRYWHVARNFRALAGGEDGREVELHEVAPFVPSEEARERARAELERAGIEPGTPYAVLNPNAGQLSLERRWPIANFARLARRLVDEDGLQVVLVGAPNEVEYTARVAAEAGALPPGALADLSGRLPIASLVALLDGAALVVSNDSGPMHVAAALGRPTVGLFGPETPTMYAPLGPRAVALWEPPICSPCINVHDNKVATCIHGRPECLVNLTVELVHARCRALLADDERTLHLFPLGPRRLAAAPAARTGSKECASSS